MGLKIHSLAELPDAAVRGYYLYLLDYGWEEPLGRSLRDNFDIMANLASRHDAAVIMGLGNEFNDEVLSWHGMNGDDASQYLPALLITNKHPSEFRVAPGSWNREHDHLVLIPLREHCKTTTDVAELIDSIFRDIVARRPLGGFSVVRQVQGGVKGAILDAVVLQPSIGGLGVDLVALVRALRRNRER